MNEEIEVAIEDVEREFIVALTLPAELVARIDSGEIAVEDLFAVGIKESALKQPGLCRWAGELFLDMPTVN